MANVKLKFKVDYFPRKKGEVVELESKVAAFYLSLGVAEACECQGKADTDKCKDCEKASDIELASAPPEVKEKKAKKAKK